MTSTELLNLPVSDLNAVIDFGVIMGLNKETKTGRIVMNNLSEAQANAEADAMSIKFPMFTFTVHYNKPPMTDTVKMVPKYCPECGNGGLDGDGNICKCRFNPDTFFSGVSCLDVPEQYRGISFNTALIPNDLDESYRAKMSEVHAGISTARTRNHNYLICSPHRHGKTIMAYSCIERLFKAGMPVFPVIDIMEARRVMRDVDMGRDSIIEINQPEGIWTVPYLFVKIPTYTSWEVYDTINTLIGRRVRKGNSTILLYSGGYDMLLRNDKTDLLTSMRGDGSFSTVEVLSWNRAYKEED